MTATTERKQEILKAAIDLILAEGVANFTIRKVADAAGISTGLVLYHFETKERLIEQAWRTSVVALGERIAMTTAAVEGREWMEATFKVRFRDQDEASVPGLLWLEYWTHVARTPELRREHSANYEDWRVKDLQRLEKAFLRKRIRPDLDGLLIVDMFHAIVCGLLVKSAIDSETITPQRAYEIGQVFLSLISTKPDSDA
jgi:AcrR family transcriptional regulator